MLGYELDDNQAIQTEIHPLNIDGKCSKRGRSWIKGHHYQEIKSIMKDVILQHTHADNQKPSSVKESRNHQILSGETLRIGYVFKKRIDHDILLSRILSNHTDSREKAPVNSLRSWKLFRDKLVLYVCPLEVSTPATMSKLFQVLNDNKLPQSQTVSISSYFNKAGSSQMTSASHSAKGGPTEGEEQQKEENVPTAPPSHGKRKVIKNLIKRSGKILSKRKVNSKKGDNVSALCKPETNKDNVNDAVQLTCRTDITKQTTVNNEMDLFINVTEQSLSNQELSDLLDNKHSCNPDSESKIFDFTALNNCNKSFTKTETVCNSSSSTSTTSAGIDTRDPGFGTDVTVYSEEQLRELGVNIDAISKQSSFSELNIIPVESVSCLPLNTEIDDDSMLPCFSFAQHKRDLSQANNTECDSDLNFDSLQPGRPLSENGNSSNSSSTDDMCTYSDNLDFGKKLITSNPAEANITDNDELESFKENSNVAQRFTGRTYQRKKHILQMFSPATSDSETDYSRKNNANTHRKNQKRKNSDSSKMLESHDDSEDDLPKLSSQKPGKKAVHHTTTDNEDLPKLSHSQNKRRKILTDNYRNKSTTEEGTGSFDNICSSQDAQSSSSLTTKEEDAYSFTEDQDVLLSRKQFKKSSYTSQPENISQLPQLLRSRGKRSKPKNLKQLTLNFLSEDKMKEEADDDRQDDCAAEDNRSDDGSLDCVLLEQLSDLPKVKNEASKELLREIRNVREVSELSQEQLRFLVLEARTHLREIFQGKVTCDRHDAYKKGGHQRKNLNYHVHLGLFTEEQQDVVMETLMSVFCKKNHKFLDYIMKVLLPEMLIKIYMEVHGVTYLESENQMKEILKQPGGIHI